MKITCDPEVDAMYIELIDGDHQCRTVRLNDEVALDFGEDEKLVGIEILDVRRVLGKGKIPRLHLDQIALQQMQVRERTIGRAATRTGPKAARRKAG
jgi:uncharacterized protein YuzE